MLVRLMDMLKINQINAFFTSLTHEGKNDYNDLTVDAVSSLADTWIRVSNSEKNDTRERKLQYCKIQGNGPLQQDVGIYDRGQRD